MLVRTTWLAGVLAIAGSSCARPGSEIQIAAGSPGPSTLTAVHLESAVSPGQPLLRRTAANPSCSDEVTQPEVLPEPITLGDFWTALATQIDALDTTALEPQFEAFAARHRVSSDSTELRRDFTRLWALFEATRDGGWWRLRWDITDQEPSSLQIWKAWLRSPPGQGFATPSAVAECDEITALFAVTARRLGVRGVGLFYPTWNHVIAGWAPEGVDPRERGGVVLIPTTQIFQGCPATFDQTTFRPPKHVYEFPRTDVKNSVEMPVRLATFLLDQVRAYGEARPALLALIRAKRADMLRSSLGDCAAYRRQLQHDVEPNLTCADRRALRHLSRVELQRPELTDEEALAFLSAP